MSPRLALPIFKISADMRTLAPEGPACHVKHHYGWHRLHETKQLNHDLKHSDEAQPMAERHKRRLVDQPGLMAVRGNMGAADTATPIQRSKRFSPLGPLVRHLTTCHCRAQGCCRILSAASASLKVSARRWSTLLWKASGLFITRVR